MASSNDNFASATVLGPDNAGSTSQDATGNTIQLGEPPPWAGAGGLSMWHRFAPTANPGTFKVLRVYPVGTAGPAIDSVLEVFEGASLTTLTRRAAMVRLLTDPSPGVASDSPWSLSLPPDREWQVRVDRLNGADAGVMGLFWGYDVLDPGETFDLLGSGWQVGMLPIG